MADILLFYPKTGFDIAKLSVDIPLSILSAACLAVKDFEISLIDQRIEVDWRARLEKELESNPLAVGISAMTGNQIHYGVQAAGVVRDAELGTRIVWGGVHPSLLPEQTLKSRFADIVVCGEGEKTLSDLARALKTGAGLDSVDGIAYKKNGEIRFTKARAPLNLNELPLLPYHLLDMESYIGSQGRFKDNSARSLIFISSRGCPWRCAFCCNPRLSGRRWRSMDAHLVYERVMELVERYDLDSVTFHDEEFLVKEDRALEIARLIDGRLSWWIQARMDRLLQVDVDALAEGGLEAVQPGIESGSDRILRMIKKGETVAQIKAANRRLARTPVVPLYNFMMGSPGETKKELDATVDLALELLDDNPKAEVSGFYVFVPYPGTELFELAVRTGFNPPRTLEEWSRYNRQHLRTPWIQEDKRELENLVFASKFIDGKRVLKRVRQALPYLPMPRGPFDMFTGILRKRWRMHDYKGGLTLELIKRSSRYFLR